MIYLHVRIEYLCCFYDFPNECRLRIGYIDRAERMFRHWSNADSSEGLQYFIGERLKDFKKICCMFEWHFVSLEKSNTCIFKPLSVMI